MYVRMSIVFGEFGNIADNYMLHRGESKSWSQYRGKSLKQEAWGGGTVTQRLLLHTYIYRMHVLFTYIAARF